MKKLLISKLSFVLIVFLGFYSCSKESIDTKKDVVLKEGAKKLLSRNSTNLNTASGSGFMSDIVIDPALEWWSQEEGTILAPYIYDIYAGYSTPQSEMSPDTSAHYFSILWNSYIPYHGNAGNNYRRLQIQFKSQQWGGTNWYYPKTENPQNNNPFGQIYKQYGLFQRTIDPVRDYPMDLSSTIFPYGNVSIRIRVVSNDFPGPNIGTASQPKYDKSLATQWVEYGPRWNEYGYGRPQPTPNIITNTWNDETTNDPGVLNIKVSLPENEGDYSYSYYITVGSIYVYGGKAPWGPEGSHNISKPQKSGIVRAVATQNFTNLNGAVQEKTQTKMMQYSASDKTASFTFVKNDF
ncbi:hypothetical protein [Sphingobacterium sp.]|uniref:hypothetical protein n=1 Tax=Sphingobacterium sp. TaxID=341027 RepID=UPI002FDE9586